MQDDQIGSKIMGLAPFDKARLPTYTIAKNSSKQPSLSAGTIPTLDLPCLQGKWSGFYWYILLIVLRFLWHARTAGTTTCRAGALTVAYQLTCSCPTLFGI
jgi:hypothetical protein